MNLFFILDFYSLMLKFYAIMSFFLTQVNVSYKFETVKQRSR